MKKFNDWTLFIGENELNKNSDEYKTIFPNLDDFFVGLCTKARSFGATFFSLPRRSLFPNLVNIVSIVAFEAEFLCQADGSKEAGYATETQKIKYEKTQSG